MSKATFKKKKKKKKCGMLYRDKIYFLFICCASTETSLGNSLHSVVKQLLCDSLFCFLLHLPHPSKLNPTKLFCGGVFQYVYLMLLDGKCVPFHIKVTDQCLECCTKDISFSSFRCSSCSSSSGCQCPPAFPFYSKHKFSLEQLNNW